MPRQLLPMSPMTRSTMTALSVFLGAVRGHGEGGRERQLPAVDRQHGGLAVLVEEPLARHRDDR
eukprot:5884277-Prorocentrum_lima.AAC.1